MKIDRKLEQSLFRMSFIIQDNATTTLDANLIKIIEAVLFDSDQSLDALELSKKIEETCSLSFSDGEIETAIKRKGKNLQSLGNRYDLIPSFRESLQRKGTFSEQLKKYVKQAIEELKLDISEDRLTAIMTEYIYYCFNANKDTLLSLVNPDIQIDHHKLSYSNEEIRLINTFMSWDNAEKNRMIYNTVSYGYIYCTMTVKKDNLLASQLFKGKRFFLDANIIFRLAGINNDARKNTITSFITKCKEVGIELCYTSDTLDEIYRVIKNKVLWIKRLTNHQAPLDLSEYDSGSNDFYTLYCTWSKNNRSYSDYLGFQKFLHGLIDSVMSELVPVEIENASVYNAEKYRLTLSSLQEYKEAHTYRDQSQASLKTDVNNILYVKHLRSNYGAQNIWSTREFFISADQNLINWSNELSSGVPIAVLPSLWLTILLRYTGRTDNDYEAFCSFLELRTHITPEEIDVYKLLEGLSKRTSSNEIKARIVRDVFENKDEYMADYSGDISLIEEKSFDKVFAQMTAEEHETAEKLEAELNEERNNSSNLQIQAEAEMAERTKKLAIYDTKKHFRIWAFLDKAKTPFAAVAFIVLIIECARIILKRSILFSKIVILIPETNDLGVMISLIALLAVAIPGVWYFVSKFFAYMNSEQRRKAYQDKQEAHYKKVFEE